MDEINNIESHPNLLLAALQHQQEKKADECENLRGKVTLDQSVTQKMEISNMVLYYNQNENFKSILFSESKLKEGFKSPPIGTAFQSDFVD